MPGDEACGFRPPVYEAGVAARLFSRSTQGNVTAGLPDRKEARSIEKAVCE